MKTRIKENIYFLFIFAIIILLLINPALYAKSALKGFLLWANVVLPALFPYFFLTQILTSMSVIEGLSRRTEPLTRRLFNAPPIFSYALLMSFLSGYPIGSKITLDLFEKGLLSQDEAKKLASISSTSGVSFVIGTMGGIMAKSVSIGVVMYLSHIISAILIGVIFRGKKSTSPPTPFLRAKTDNILETAMFSSISSILLVGGYIALFFVFGDLIINTRILLPLESFFSKLLLPFGIEGEAIVRGVLEVTSGVSMAFSSSNNIKAATIIATALISFGGISINIQCLTFLKKVGIKSLPYLCKKILHAVFASVICFIFLLFL